MSALASPAPAFNQAALTTRWTQLKYHKEQARLFHTPSRFCIVPPGRRSGKTEIAKRRLATSAMTCQLADGWYIAAAPTHGQAKRIYWNDLKRLVPKWMMAKAPSESELTIYLLNGAQITVMGMDAPERLEGRPVDGIVLDEYANMRREVWTANVRPALSTPGRPPGWAWLVGVPEGRNHYYELYRKAMRCRAEAAKRGMRPAWDVFHWPSWDIIDAAEIQSAKEDLDEQTFRQEYGGEFVSYEGLAYYPFKHEIHAATRLLYDPTKPIALCFDFNVSPGVAVVVQEQEYQGPLSRKGVAKEVTGVIGEIYIPRHSNTEKVCRALISRWGQHQGDVICYGDATGGSSGSAKVQGSDWDLIWLQLRPVFGNRLKTRVPAANPKERVRVNAMNSRLRSADGTVRMLIDPVAAPHVVRCVADTPLLEGGSGEIDKEADDTLTHMSDALGYYVEKRFPVRGGSMTLTTSV